jgi:3-phenylpropionate/cinnamic acid dioxygenase small subunit
MEELACQSGAVGMSAAPVPVGSADYNTILEWLYREAAMLDRGEFSAWFKTLAPDIVYDMPTRMSVYPKDGDGFDPNFGFFAENHASLETRVKRLQTDQAWAEQPGSRTRHYVSNLLVDQLEDGTFLATSAFLVTRIRSDMPYDLFTGERRDILRVQGDGLVLAKRTILIDQTVLKSYNLSIFF